MIDLQTMLDKCALVGSQLGIAFNSTKSKSIIIGPNVLHSKSVNFLTLMVHPYSGLTN